LRSEIEELVTGTIGGDDASSWTFMHLLDGYAELPAAAWAPKW
jgi:hypothetical protein